MTTLYLDISLHSTGYCVLIYVRNKPAKVVTGLLDNSLSTDRQASLRSVFTALSIINLVDKYKVEKIVIEDYAFSKFANSRAASTLAEIRGAIHIMTVQYGINITFVSPNTSVKSLTGCGKYKDRAAKKEATIAAANLVVNHTYDFPGIVYDVDTVTDDNIADAIALYYHDNKDKFTRS